MHLESTRENSFHPYSTLVVRILGSHYHSCRQRSCKCKRTISCLNDSQVSLKPDFDMSYSMHYEEHCLRQKRCGYLVPEFWAEENNWSYPQGWTTYHIASWCIKRRVLLVDSKPSFQVKRKEYFCTSMDEWDLKCVHIHPSLAYLSIRGREYVECYELGQTSFCLVRLLSLCFISLKATLMNHLCMLYSHYCVMAVRFKPTYSFPSTSSKSNLKEEIPGTELGLTPFA